MKRKWSLRLGAAVLCAVLLGSCGSTAAAPAESTAPADPLTGQQLLYPEQRAAAVVIENTTDSTTQWGIGSASVVLEAMTESGSSTELCLVYPALSAMPVVGPVTRGQDLYWRLLSGQQVLPIQCGSSAYAKRYLEYYNLRAVDAQEVGRNAFVSTGYSWDNTPLWRTSGKAVASVLDSLSISTAVNQNTTSGSESETAGVLPTLLPQRDTGHLALSMTMPLPPTGCCTPMAPPSWMPTPAHRRSLTTCSSCTAAPPCGTMAARWTTTFPWAAASG